MAMLKLSSVPAEEAAPFYKDFLAAFPDGQVGIHLQFDLRTVEELVSEFTLQRASTLALVNGIPPAAWPRVGTANGFRTSARALVYIILGHTAHHCRVLRERYRLPATG
jgi:hypothetical protein